MNQWVTHEILALLICWAVGTIMGKLEQLTQTAQLARQERQERQERLPRQERQDDTRKDSALQSTSVLDKLANAQASRNDDAALIEAFRIVAQERRKGIHNGK